MFFISVAYADAATSAAASPLIQFVPIVLVFVVMYFFMIRPQSKKAQEHKTMVDSLQRGASIMTNGGIFGSIKSVQEDKATIEIAEGVEIVILKSAIASVVDGKMCSVVKTKSNKSKKAASSE